MEKRSAVREKIVENSKKLFKQHGFNATSMQMIADACNVSKSLVKYYFPKKEDISSFIMKKHLDSIRAYVKTLDEVKNDAVLAYVLTMKIYYADIYGNESVNRFNKEALMDASGKKMTNETSNMDEVYKEIIAQYNLSLSDKMFFIRKIQIMGSQVFLIDASENPESEITDSERFEGAIYSTLSLLGVGAFYCNDAIAKANRIYENNDLPHFSML